MAHRNRLVDAGLRLLTDVVKKSFRQIPKPGPRRRPRGHDASSTTGKSEHPRTDTITSDAYPGDFTGRPRITYSPVKDGLPDPGEVVWTWIPYEEDHSQGKDRPALIIGSDGPWLLVLQVTSKDHDRDAGWEASQGRFWEDIGTGAWDSQGRPSEVRLNRIIRIDPAKVRRIGAILDEETFRMIAGLVLQHY